MRLRRPTTPPTPPARRAAEAEAAAEGARREAAKVGGELAAVNHFLRAHTGAPGGAPALADELDVATGLELALAAALGRRMRAAIAPDLSTGASLLDRAGDDGGSALIADSSHPPDPVRRTPDAPPVPGAERLLDHVRGPADALSLASTLLADAWVVESLEGLPPSFTGIAVTRGGRVWFGATRELRQVPAGGEDRVLSERNRREELIAASAAAAGAERDALARSSAPRPRRALPTRLAPTPTTPCAPRSGAATSAPRMSAGRPG